MAIHAPRREGDDRNHHAHVLTTTRVMGADGLSKKTRVLDVAQTGGPEIEAMRGVWAGLQNDALERAGEPRNGLIMAAWKRSGRRPSCGATWWRPRS